MWSIHHYGQLDNHIHAIQLEFPQATHLNDELSVKSEYQLDDKKLPVIKQQLKDVIEAVSLVGV